MTETELISSSVCEDYFKTERFDRNNGEKIFTITFAALLEADFRAPSCDYETFFKLTRTLTKDAAYDKEQLYKIMCFNVLTHNRDDHTKNFSFIHSNLNGWKLAPAYDITYSDTYWGEHATSVNGKRKNITDQDLINLGVAAGLSDGYCRQCFNEIHEKTQALEQYLNPHNGKTGIHQSFHERLSELN